MAVLSGYTPPAGISDSASVRAMQQKLNASGANIAVDGKWGPQTDAAYKSYNSQQEKQSQIQSLIDSAKSASSRVGSSYSAAGKNYETAEKAAYEATKADLEGQKTQVSDQYEDIRSQAYVNARLNAINNNEVLASQGLAGNLYDEARSGVSETSRIQGDVAMRNDINSATRNERLTLDQIEQMIIQAGYTRDQNIASQLAQLAIQRAGAESIADQNALNNILNLMQFQEAITPTPAPQKSTSKSKSSGLSDSDIVSLLSGKQTYGNVATQRQEAADNAAAAKKTTTTVKPKTATYGNIATQRMERME